MAPRTATDMDFLAANIHGRRSHMAEAERLDDLCRIRSVAELARVLFPEAGIFTAVELQRRLVLDIVGELTSIAGHVGGAGGRLFDWLCVRFQVENLKVLARAFSSSMSVPDVLPHLIPLKGDLAMRAEPFLAAGSVEAFAALLPSEVLSESVLRLAAAPYARHPRPFYIEAALDHGYLTELLARTRALPSAARSGVLEIARQETGIFHLALAARGRLTYQVKAEDLAPFIIWRSGVARADVLRMLASADLAELAARAVGHAIDAAPAFLRGPAGPGRAADPSVLEALSWNRFYRVANRAFRRSHMGLGAVVAYASIRRVEVANLISLSEGIRAGAAPEVIRRRLIPRQDIEGAHV